MSKTQLCAAIFKCAFLKGCYNFQLGGCLMEETERYYRIGGLTISLRGPDFSENAFLRPFRCERSVPDVSFTVVIGHPTMPKQQPVQRSEHKVEYLKNGRRLCVLLQEHSEAPLLVREERSDGSYCVCLEESCLPLYDNNLVLKLLELPKLLAAHGAFFLHASFIAYGGQAILFTAPKQTGKSTQAALWNRYRGAEIINGDRVLLRKTQGVWAACGSPYCGTSGICKNRVLPVRAIVLLSQAEKNEVFPAGAKETAAAFLNGCTYEPQTQTEAMLDFALNIWQEIPIFRFACRPDASAVLCLEQALAKEYPERTIHSIRSQSRKPENTGFTPSSSLPCWMRGSGKKRRQPDRKE